jgi:hypothetical protein
VTLVACAAVLGGCPRPAAADTGGAAHTDDAGIAHEANSDESTAGSGGSGRQKCTYTLLDISGDESLFDVDGSRIEVDGTGFWYEKWCEGNVFYGAIYVSRRDPADLIADARRYLALPPPDPVTSPAEDQIVNLPTWLWLNTPWEPLTSTASVPGVSVTVRAVPEVAVWTMGDGAQVLCDGPGTPYNLALPEAAQTATCAYTYGRSSALQPDARYRASVTVRWHASWSVAGFAGGGELGTIDRTTAFPVRVGEVQAINTGAG